jgi:hypothetical protein
MFFTDSNNEPCFNEFRDENYYFLITFAPSLKFQQ